MKVWLEYAVILFVALFMLGWVLLDDSEPSHEKNGRQLATNDSNVARQEIKAPEPVRPEATSVTKANEEISSAKNELVAENRKAKGNISSQALNIENISLETLSVLENAQTLVEEGKFETAALALNKLYERSESLSDSDKLALFDIYAGLMLAIDRGPEAIDIYERLLALENVPLLNQALALKGLGRSYMTAGEWNAALNSYTEFFEKSQRRDAEVLLDLSYAHYQLEQYSAAIAPVVEHIQILYDSTEVATDETLKYVNGLAFTTENWETAVWVTQLLIERNNNAVDWRNLIGVYRAMNDSAAADQAFEDAVMAGKIDRGGNLLDN